jgi:hypothetical protein
MSVRGARELQRNPEVGFQLENSVSYHGRNGDFGTLGVFCHCDDSSGIPRQEFRIGRARGIVPSV